MSKKPSSSKTSNLRFTKSSQPPKASSPIPLPSEPDKSPTPESSHTADLDPTQGHGASSADASAFTSQDLDAILAPFASIRPSPEQLKLGKPWRVPNSEVLLADMDRNDFCRRISEGEGSWSPGGHYQYTDPLTGNEAEFIVIGEVGSVQDGTDFSSRGNKKVLSANNPAITDNTVVKNTIALRCPAYAAPNSDFAMLTSDQITTIDDVQTRDEKEPDPLHRVIVYKYRTSCIRISPRRLQQHIELGDYSVQPEPDILLLTLPPKYAKPPRGAVPAPPAHSWHPPPQDKHSPLKKKRVALHMSAPTTKTETSDAMTVDDEGPIPAPHTESVTLHSLHDPCLHFGVVGDPAIKLQHARLVTLDIKDVDGNYVPPWRYHHYLRPGTLIIARATLTCWIYRDKSQPYESYKQTYQVIPQSIRILKQSDGPIEDPVSFDSLGALPNHNYCLWQNVFGADFCHLPGVYSKCQGGKMWQKEIAKNPIFIRLCFLLVLSSPLDTDEQSRHAISTV
ncbi:hypothetical protein K474DRAFT_1706963 [Panus rudis PR-1116 ss-1]|nr:hypothetical protein K474DRAFT_1706963 [Panus rudis PR-1116 ss-1]